MYFTPDQGRQFWTENVVIFSQNWPFSAKTGYFLDLPKRAFPAKQGLKLGAFLEKSTNRGKSGRTRKFTLARDHFADFSLGRILLRSARSKLDGLAFYFTTEARTATTANPLTA